MRFSYSKFIRAAAVLLAILLGLGACTAGLAKSNSGKPKVIATIFAPYDFARQVAGDLAEVTMLLPPGSESHSFEPTPKDILNIKNCDVFVYVGGESDEWVRGILGSLETSRLQLVPLMDCVQTLEEETVEGMQAEKAEPGSNPEYDEHVWTAPRNAQLIVDKIRDALCAADPVHQADYTTNAADYNQKLAELDAQFRAVVVQAKRSTIVFGDRFPFRYFAESYGLSYFAAFAGCASETEATPATVKFLIDKIRAEQIPLVFQIELANGRMAQVIANETGAKAKTFYACHNISRADFAAGKTYLDYMNHNLNVLREALA
jgi:zinc transport system substrate-binding protein